MVLTVILADTNRTYTAIIHENEWMPYKRRAVKIELTEEQKELIRGRVVGIHGNGSEIREEMVQCWIEERDA